jgi:protein ImuA
MILSTGLPSRLPAEQLAALRAQIAQVQALRGPVLPFGVAEIDARLASGGLDGAALHEIAGASASWSDDAAATLFAAGLAARFAVGPGMTVLWALSRFDLYAPGLEHVGLGPDKVLYAQGAKDAEVLALAEDALRDGSLGCVIAEVKSADQTATRRLQLAASDGGTPMLLYRRHRSRERSPLASPSTAIGALEPPPPHPYRARGQDCSYATIALSRRNRNRRAQWSVRRLDGSTAARGRSRPLDDRMLGQGAGLAGDIAAIPKQDCEARHDRAFRARWPVDRGWRSADALPSAYHPSQPRPPARYFITVRRWSTRQPW